MPGIFSIYTGFADGHVHLRQKKGKVDQISRAKVELQILTEVIKAEIPFSVKMSWYQAVLASTKFDSYWVNVASQNNLPEACTARYVPDDSLLEYEVPAEDEVEEDPVDEVGSEADDYAVEDGESSSDSSDDSFSSDISDRGSELDPLHFVRFERSIPYCNRCKGRGHSTIACHVNNDPWTVDDWESVDSDEHKDGHEAKQQCRRMFLAGLPSVPGEPGRNVEEWLNTVVVTRESFYTALGVECPPQKEKHDDACEEEEDEGAYEEPPSESKAKGKAKAPSTTLKNTSKPKGITKTKATPKKKKETAPAQLLLAVSKTIGPAQPQTEQEASTPIPSPTTPAQVPSGSSDNHPAAPTSKAPIEGQGTKRTLEEIADEQEAEEGYPATKKFKTGGAASPNGGRKIATPKKVVRFRED